jgi:hypothetical protein
MSAYDNLQKEFGAEKVRFGNPVRSGKSTATQGFKEITKEIDEATKKIEPMSSTALMRCEALKKYLSDGKKVWIKTATGFGHAR